MQARMKNAAMLIPDALPTPLAFPKTEEKGGLPPHTIGLVHVRASQINGCSVCLDMHTREMKQAGEPDERINMGAAWRGAPHFTDAERAGLALTECVTRIAHRPEPGPDQGWDEAARPYDQRALAALLIAISTINVFNRITVAPRQVAFGALPQPAKAGA